MFAATHKRRDVFVGASTPPTILASRLAPSVMDRVLAKQGYSGQLSKAAAPKSDGNLFEPAPGGEQGAHGRFDVGAKTRRDIYSSRQADVVAAGLLLVGVVGLKMLATSPLFVAPGLLARAVVRRVMA